MKEWREGKSRGRPRDAPFNPPDFDHTQEESDTSSYYPQHTGTGDMRPLAQINEDDEPQSPFADPQVRTRYGTGPPPSLPPVDVSGSGPRQSMDTYGAFSDPAPSGYLDPPDGVSRTMAYADPYAAVRANIGPRVNPTSPTSQPPSYQY